MRLNKRREHAAAHASLPTMKPVAAAVALTLGVAATEISAADFILGSPAVQQAYIGEATQAKKDAALAGLTQLTSQLTLLPCWSCVNAGIIIGTGPGIVFPFVPAPLPLNALIQAASDTDLGAPGTPVILDSTLLRTLASFSTARNFQIGGGGAGIDTNGFNFSITGDLTANGELRKYGLGTLVLTGNNVWNIAPTVEQGVLEGNSVSLQTAIANNAVVRFNQSGAGTYSHVISGSGGLEKAGAGTLTLAGANSHSGLTTISEGVLALQGAGRPGSGSLLIQPGATFNISGATGSVGIGALNGGGNVVLGSHILSIYSSSDMIFSGVISGAGGISKGGAGTLSLSGVNIFTGPATIGNSRLALIASGRLSSLTSVSLADATLDISASNAGQAVGSLRGSGSVLLGTNTLTVGLDNSDATFTGAISGTGGLTKTGIGTLSLSGTNTYTGVTTIAQGTLVAKTSSISNTVSNIGTLVLTETKDLFVPFISAYSGNIAGSGRFIKDGDGIIWLRGVNTYTGGTTVNGGILIGNTDGLQGDITNNSGLAFYQVTDGTYAGRLEGAGTLFMYGPGVLTLTGNNTYTGGTAFSGIIRIANDSNVGASSGAVLMAGGTLQAAADITSARQFVLGSPGGAFDTNGFNIVSNGVISGAGSLTKTGMGALTLNAINTYSGPTLVNAGRLAVNGSIASNVTIAAGGELGGTGAITGNVINSGRIARGEGIGNININGNVTFAPASTFTVKANAAGASDRLLVTGATSSATLQGGTVNLQAASGTYQPQTRYTILTAQAGVTGAFSGATSNLVFLKPVLGYDANNVFLTLNRNDASFESVAVSPDQSAVGKIFSGLQGTASGDMALVVNTLTSLSAPDARAAFDSIAGKGRAASVQVNTLGQRAVNQNISGRLALVDSGSRGTTVAGLEGGGVKLAFEEATRSDASPVYAQTMLGYPSGTEGARSQLKHGWWLRGFGGAGKVDGDASNGGSSYRLSGVIVGYDYALGDHGTLGAFGSYAKPKLEQDLSAGRTDTHSYQLGLYGRYREGAAHVDAMISAAHNSTDTSRAVTVGALNRTATAGYDGLTTSAQVEAGYTFKGRVDVTPLVGLQWIRQRQNDYTEQGADALNLVVPSRAVNSLRSTLGVRASYPFDIDGGMRMAIEARAAWAHEFRDQGALNARLAGDTTVASFSVTGINIPRDTAVLGLGLSAEAKRNLRLYADVSAELNGVQRSVVFSAGMRYQW